MSCRSRTRSLLYLFCILLFFVCVVCKENDRSKRKDEAADKWKKKLITDYSDADIERLFDQWEENDEELPEDELPEWKRQPPKIDMSQIDPSNPEAALRMSKKGRSLMMFATVSGNPTEKETDQITQIWQHSLFNANMEVQRYTVSSNRVIFMLKDGSLAWNIKDYLIEQDRCEEVTIEGKSYPGKSAKGTGKQEDNQSSKKKDDTQKKNKESGKYSKDKNIKDNRTKRDKKGKEEL